MNYTANLKEISSTELIKFCPNGVSRKRAPSRLRSSLRPSQLSNSRRGEITSFSRHSSLRLRRALVELSPEKGDLSYTSLGITITLPWRLPDDFDSDSVHSDYKIAFNRFSVSFRRRFPNSAAIFRHEIQRRGAPHSHIVCYLSDFDFHLVRRGRCANVNDLRAIVFSMWSNALQGFNYDVNIPAFVRRGVKIDLLSDNIAMFRYLADHQSKKKLCQLGYKGKQWGFINRKCFVSAPSSVVSFSSSEDRLLFWRHLSKVCRYTVPDSRCSFGSRLSRRCDGRSVFFVSRLTSERLYFAIAYGRISYCPSLSHVYRALSFWLWFFAVLFPNCRNL